MEDNEQRATSNDSAHAYDSDSCPDEADMQSAEGEDNEIFHECQHDDETDIQIISKRAETTEYDPQLPRTPAAEGIGNIQIAEEQNDGDHTIAERSVISDMKTKADVTPQNVETPKGTEHKYPDIVRYCDLCKDSNLYIPSSSYCTKCDESYCIDCTKIHRSQKATKEHEIGPPKPREALFMCETCSSSGTKNPAVASCKECEELYCDTCSSAHKRQKATKGHSILSHSGLSERGTCEPCKENEHGNKSATHLCIDCDEVQCYDCFCVHSKQKATKKHCIVCSMENDENCCRVCYKRDKWNMPDMYCRACSIKLCTVCAGIHRQDPTTRDHKVLDIPNTLANEQHKICDNSLELPQVMTTRTKSRDKPAKQKFDSKSEAEEMKPGVPCLVGQVKLDSICLAWEPPKHLLKDRSYQVRYKEAGSITKWTGHPVVTSNPTITLSNLKSNTKYVAQVRMVNEEKEGPYSDVSDSVETIQSAAARLMDFMYDTERSDVEMPLKKLPLRENKRARNLNNKTRQLIMGGDKRTYSKERTIMLVGATGTGKSTLVDGMINYILGVNWSDPYRLTVVDLEEEEINRDENQAVSQTQWITCYTIHPSRGSCLDYTLNIVDTPGFGDTRGIERDREIVQQIRNLFSNEGETGIVFIDAICFLIKAPDARLTPTQMYIFNAIMSLFGQDIADNFCMLVTFADGKRPPVLSALKEAKLPHERYFPFNNSGLFSKNTDASGFSSMFWEMGCKSFSNFFRELVTLDTKSLKQTKDVLKQRELIEVSMENLLPKLDSGLHKVEEMRTEIRVLEENKTQIEANSDFTYTVSETEQKQIDLPIGQHVTNCLTCHKTCHKDCKIPNDEDKSRCIAMNDEGYCTQCPLNCFWDIHRNTPYIFDYITVQKQKTYTEKLEIYRRVRDESMTRTKVVERMQEELFAIEDEIMILMAKINECNNILADIALRSDPLSVVEHIELLIESEKMEKRTGFQARISSLQQCRRRATVGADVKRFTATFTDTRKFTAVVTTPKKKGHNNSKKEKAGIFQSVVNFFQN